MSDSDDVSATSATPGDSAAAGAAGDPVLPTAVGGEVTVGTEGPEGPITAGERHGDLVPEPWGRMIMALAPPVALILFFVTHNWLWFLAIPIAGILVYGPDGDADRRRSRYRRDRRRNP